MPHIPIFFIFMSAVIIVHFAIAGTKRTSAKKTKSFWEREEEANHTRRTDISGLPYINVAEAGLPLDRADALGLTGEASVIRDFIEHPGKRILNLSMYTNTDLKAMYGPANLEDLTFYDENFTVLIRALNKLGSSLADAGDTEDARAVFAYAVGVGSDITETWTRLGGIYKQAGDEASLNALIASAEALTSLSGPTITNKLNSIKSMEK